jgi:signal recognition particle subunit SRP54
MGNLESILKMIPGAGKAMKQMGNMQLPDKEMKKIEAIINSMTPRERRDQKILNGSRRLRIAKGSGTTVQDVNQLMKRFGEAQKMMKKLQKMGPKGMKNLMGRGGGLPF